MDRRLFFKTVTSLTLGVGGFFDLDRLDSLLPTGGDESPMRRIGAADVELIEQTTAALRAADFRYGGGLARPAALAQFKQVLTLQDAICTDEVRSRLFLATAELAAKTGFLSYDVERHEDARRFWLIALETARRSDHPLSRDLTVGVLADMAHQALYLDRAEEALQLSQLGTTLATSSTQPISPGSKGYLAGLVGRSWAKLGKSEACRRALDDVDRAFAEVDPSTAPPWAGFVTPNEHDALRGQSFVLLAESDPAFAQYAVEHLNKAVQGYDEAYARSRAVNLPLLANGYFLAGDVAAGVQAGHDAVAAAEDTSSQRAHARLKELSEIAAPFDKNSDVADLRHRIQDTTTPPPD